MIGTTIGQYEIVEQIGEGGMAAVYRAYQPSIKRYVAVKIILGGMMFNEAMRERFVREAQLVAQLEHPHILPIHDYDATNNPPYIVMRYLEGATVGQVMERSKIPLEEIAFMLNQVASALDYAHRRGVVHRDIKPSNVMLDPEGNAYLMDFGIARQQEDSRTQITMSGMFVGTPAYMSPEQANGEKLIDHRTDIYSLGVMLYQLVTGRLPFEGDSVAKIMYAHIQTPPEPPSEINPNLPLGVDTVLMTALAKDPNTRYQSAEELAIEFTRAVEKVAPTPRVLRNMTSKLTAEMKSKRPPVSARKRPQSNSGSQLSQGSGIATSFRTPPPANQRSNSVLWGVLMFLLFVVGGLGYLSFSGQSLNDWVARFSQPTPTITREAVVAINDTPTQTTLPEATATDLVLTDTPTATQTDTPIPVSPTATELSAEEILAVTYEADRAAETETAILEQQATDAAATVMAEIVIPTQTAESIETQDAEATQFIATLSAAGTATRQYELSLTVWATQTPLPDRDRDGIADKLDLCPNESGLRNYGGCSAPTATNTPRQTATRRPTTTPTPTPTTSNVGYQAEAIINVASANLRNGPGTNYGIAGSADEGDSLPITAQYNDWYLIEKSNGDDAWVWSGIVNVSNPQNTTIAVASSIPPTPVVVVAAPAQSAPSTSNNTDSTGTTPYTGSFRVGGGLRCNAPPCNVYSGVNSGVVVDNINPYGVGCILDGPVYQDGQWWWYVRPYEGNPQITRNWGWLTESGLSADAGYYCGY